MANDSPEWYALKQNRLTIEWQSAEYRLSNSITQLMNYVACSEAELMGNCISSTLFY